MADTHSQPVTGHGVLIIGFPQLLPRVLALRVLADNETNRVFLLVKQDELKIAEEFVAAIKPHYKERLEILVGDLNSVELRLSGAEAQRLFEQVTLVFHALGNDQIRRSEVAGALKQVRNVIALCHEMKRLSRLSIFSTAFVSGDRSGLILEEELEHGQRLRTPFERSMFTIEKFARGHMPRLPITVYRPSAMIGHCRTGDGEGLTEGPGYLLGLMLRLPTEVPFFVPGAGIVPFNIVPIDYVVDAAWSLATNPSASGRTFHLTDPNPMSAKQAFELLAEITNRPSPLFGRWASGVFKGLIRSTGLSAVLPRSWAVFDDLTRHVTYNCNGALDLLADTDVVCPPFEDYADMLVRWMDRFERKH